MLGKEGISQKAQLKQKAMLLAVLLEPGGGVNLWDRLLQLIRKLCDRVSCRRMPFRVLLKQWIFAKFYATGYRM